MSDFQNAVIKLLSSPHYKELATYEPPFNPFEIVGATHRELIHSSVLAWLLRDEANREFRQKFVTWIRDNIVAGNIVAEAEKKEELKKLWKGLKPEDSSLKPIIETEVGDKTSRIDVFAHFESLNLVIGIEVKVWAGEQHEQVKRYQELLCQYHPNPDYKKAVVFLTPEGWEPRTDDENNVDVPVLMMSWGCVSKIIREMRSVLGDENDFRMQFSQHLERNIAMNEKEEQRIVRELLSEGDNAETLDKIIRNMPSLQDYSAQWKKMVAEICGVEEDSLLEYIYPAKRGIVKELKICVREWCEAGLPFTVMLYKYQKAGIRILLYQGAFHEEAKAKLEKFAEFANRSGRVVNEEFPQLIGWSAWRSVLKNDGTDQEIKGTLIDNIWSEDWKKEAKDQLQKQIKDSRLLETINEWIETKGANKG